MSRSKTLLLILLACLTSTLLLSPTVYAQDDEADGGRLYWSKTNSIVRAKMDGSDPETFLIGLNLRAPVFNADGTRMYGIGSDGVIRRAHVDGSGLTALFDPGNDPTNLRIDTEDENLYWLDDTSVRRADLNGGQVETLVISQTNPIGLRLDLHNDKMYWSDDSRHIRRANLDGTMLETVYSAPPEDTGVSCLNIDPEANKVYWLLNEGGFNGPIMRANGDGSNVETLPLEDICPVLNEDNNKLYWVVRDLDDASIQRANLDGSNVEEIVADASIASNGLSFDPAGGKLYWYESELEDSRIRRADLDGGPAEDIVPLSTNGGGLYLNLAQQSMIWELEGVLYSAGLDGTDPATVLVGIRTAGRLALDLEGGRIFWGDASSIRVANLDGTGTQIFWRAPTDNNISFSFGPSLLQTDAEAGRLYWITIIFAEATSAQSAQRVLFSANLDGSDLQQEGVIPLIGPYALDLVNQRVYGYYRSMDNPIPQQLTSELSSVELDGSDRLGLGIFDNMGGINLNLAVDGAGGKVYWTAGGTVAFILQANLDGSEQTEFMEDVSSSVALAIDAQSSKIYWSRQPGGDNDITERANLDGSARETILNDDVSAFAFDPAGVGTPTPGEDTNTLHLPFLGRE